MSTVEFNGEEWPVRLDFSAIKRTLPLFGLRYTSEFDKLVEKMDKEFPMDAVGPFIRNVVLSGMRYTGDEREVPTLDDIERAMDDDFELITKVFKAVEEKSKAPQVTAQKAVKGKKKAPTPKP